MGTPRILGLVGFVILVSLSGTGASTAGTWTSIGPDGGPVVAFTRDLSTASELYASTGQGGVFHSEDDGGRWVRSNEGLNGRTTGPIAAATGGTVLVGTDGGLFRSVDHGAHWSPVIGVPSLDVRGLAVDERNPALLYAGVRPASGSPSLFRSADAGASWAPTSNPGEQGYPITLDPTSQTIYSGAFKSSDGGATWVRYGTPNGVILVAINRWAYPYEMVVDPRSPATLFAVVRVTQIQCCPSLVGGSVYRSDDGGLSFAPTETEPPSVATSIALSPSGDLYLGTADAGLFRSSDRGHTWSSVPGAPLGIAEIRTGPAPARIVVGTSNRGLWRSADAGANWESRSTGLRSMTIGSIALDPRVPSTIWVASADVGGGVRMSRDGGDSWADVSGNLPSDHAIHGIAVDPHDSHRALAGTFRVSRGLFVGDGAVFRTEDAGGSWVPSFLPGIVRVAFDPEDSRIAHASGNAVARSTNGGASWSIVALGSGALAIDPADPRFVYTGSVRSSDRGLTWSPLGLSSTRAVAVAPAGVVFAGGETGVWKSFDHGASFVPTGAELASIPISTLAIDPRNARVFAATAKVPYANEPAQDGVFSSRDGGASWQGFSEGLPIGDVPAIAVDETTGILYAGTGGAGLYRRAESDASCVSSATVLCLGGGRFRAQVAWRTASGSDVGQARTLTEDAGAFWFFSANNLELVLKVVNGTAVNGKFWVFGAGLTDVEYDLAITDTTTGIVWTRHNSQGRSASFADTSAF